MIQIKKICFLRKNIIIKIDGINFCKILRLLYKNKILLGILCVIICTITICMQYIEYLYKKTIFVSIGIKQDITGLYQKPFLDSKFFL